MYLYTWNIILKFGKCQRQQRRHRRHGIYLVRTSKQYRNIVPCAHLVLQKRLTAGPAWRRRLLRRLAVGSDCGYRDRFKTGVWEIGSCVIARRTFGTRTRWIGYIFLIGTGDCLTIVQQNGRADTEMAVRGVSACRCRACGINELALGRIQLLIGSGYYVIYNLYFFHSRRLYCAKIVNIIQKNAVLFATICFIPPISYLSSKNMPTIHHPPRLFMHQC